VPPSAAQPLVVVALRSEAAHLGGRDVLLTGIGKVAAAVAVAGALADRRPPYVLNVGTAGALHDGLHGAHVIGRVVEHDLDHAFLRGLTGEDVVGEIVLDEGAPTTLATGDAFVSDPALRAVLAQRAQLVDMEGFAVAAACARAGVPCRMVKVVSDEASEDAARTWQERADATARQIAAVVAEHV
jgi:adenosylhomocysteine nucleosidase